MLERLKNLEDTIVKRVEKNNGSIFRKSKIENIQKFGVDWKCTNFILKAIQHRKSLNIIFIAVVTLMSDSELVLNKRRASKWYVIRVCLFSCHESCLYLPEKGP